MRNSAMPMSGRRGVALGSARHRIGPVTTFDDGTGVISSSLTNPATRWQCTRPAHAAFFSMEVALDDAIPTFSGASAC